MVQPLQPDEGLTPHPDEERLLYEHQRVFFHVVSDVPQRSILHREADPTRYRINDRVVIGLSVGCFAGDVNQALVNGRHDMVLMVITCSLK